MYNMKNNEYINIRIRKVDRDRLTKYALLGETFADAVTRVLDKVEEKGGDQDIYELNIKRRP